MTTTKADLDFIEIEVLLPTVSRGHLVGMTYDDSTFVWRIIGYRQPAEFVIRTVESSERFDTPCWDPVVVLEHKSEIGRVRVLLSKKQYQFCAAEIGKSFSLGKTITLYADTFYHELPALFPYEVLTSWPPKRGFLAKLRRSIG